MSNEKQTDPFHWKNKLEDLDSLPGESTDKSALWEKLHGRLHEKNRSRKAIWYWPAACLLLLATIPMLFTKKTGNTVPVKEIVRTKKSPITPETPVKINTEEIKTAGDIPVVKKEKIKKILVERIRNTGNKPVLTEEPAIARSNEPVATPVESTNVAVHDSGITAIALKPAKKKLPVVHINELGKEEQDNAPFATHSQRSSFQIKFLNQDNYTGSSLPANHTATDMLKMKIPLKN